MTNNKWLLFNYYMRYLFFILLFMIIFHKFALSDQEILSGADIDYGEYLSGECVTCHNKDGLDRGIPSIIGLDADVFIALMLAYKAGDMENQAMQMFAGRLDNNQIGSLALYFSRLKPPK